MVKKGVFGNYTWFQSSSNYLSELVGQVSGLVVGKHVAVVAHDGVPLRLTRDELRNGWQQINQLAMSRLVQRPAEIPHNHFDEWYCFTPLDSALAPTLGVTGISASAGPIMINESFVNYGGFSLESREVPKPQRSRIYPFVLSATTAPAVAAPGATLTPPSVESGVALPPASRPSLAKQRLERFWQGILCVMPESYLLENDKLIIVTCNPELVVQLDAFFANARFRLPIKSGLTHRLGALFSDLPKKL